MINKKNFAVRQMQQRLFNTVKHECLEEEKRLFVKYGQSVLPMIAQFIIWKEQAKKENAISPCVNCKFGSGKPVREDCWYRKVCLSAGGWLSERTQEPVDYLPTPEQIIIENEKDNKIQPFYDYRIMVIWDKEQN